MDDAVDPHSNPTNRVWIRIERRDDGTLDIMVDAGTREAQLLSIGSSFECAVPNVGSAVEMAHEWPKRGKRIDA